MDKISISQEFFKDELKQIYCPAEDSFLLLDAVAKDLRFIRTKIRPKVCLEIGAGSGVVINSVAKTLGANSCQYFATDINPIAVEATIKSGRLNNVYGVEVILTNVVDAVKQTLRNKVDLLLSNPPFEPSPPTLVGEPGQRCAWCAGTTGRAIIDKILPEVADLLSDHGVFYMVCCRENNIADIFDIMKLNYGLVGKVIVEKDATTSSDYDRLYHQYVLRFSTN